MAGREVASAGLRGLLAAVAADMEAHVDDLRELDAAAGDGDLGITFQLAAGALADTSAAPNEDVGLMLAGLGMAINRVSPSTFGTLLASAFMSAGSAVRGRTSVGAGDVAAMGSAAVEGVKKRGKADVGDKTMLDALVPAVQAYERELGQSGDAERAAAAAVDAAANGVDATAAMVAKFGRAAYRGEESKGLRDAGAAAVYFLIEALARRT